MIPEQFVERLTEIVGDGVAQHILATMRTPKAIGLWQNPLAMNGASESAAAEPLVVRLSQDLGLAAPAASELPGCWRMEHHARAAIMRHALVAEGAIYPINPASLFAAQALGVEPGQEVLDLAAAPGGKSLVLAAALTPDGRATGRLALVEPVKSRFHRLRANMQRCSVQQADYYQRDGRGVSAAVGERFDRVLLDAPCSSEARFHCDDANSMSPLEPEESERVRAQAKGLVALGVSGT